MASSSITSWQIDGETMKTVTDFLFLGSKIIADADCSHIKRRLLLWRTAMTNLDSILKSRDITLLTKICIVRAMVFPVVIYAFESWTIKKAVCRRIDAFELWCWRRLLRVPGQQGDQTSPSQRKPTLNIHWQDWCWSWSSNTLDTWIWRANSLEKTLMLGKIEGRRRRRGTEKEMTGCHHWLEGYKFEQTPGDGEEQEILAGCSSWGRRAWRRWATWTRLEYISKTKKTRMYWLLPYLFGIVPQSWNVISPAIVPRKLPE